MNPNNPKNFRRKTALIRAEKQLKDGGYTHESLGFLKNSETRVKQLEYEVAVLQTRIVK